jgi:alkanesulfonate monooxygenase SsuD/methylene tetrahydromethanopterin reductase-like flavin-dependent oxidoreductase (luciferase family)
VEIGVHLPLIDFGDGPGSARELAAFAGACADAGFAGLAANDHFVFARPWLDGLTALAAVAAHAGELTLATTVALPVVRGPIPLAAALAALDVLTGGRVVAGVSVGSSPRDYAAAGVDFDERWLRFDDALPAMRAFWRGSGYEGVRYTVAPSATGPRVARPDGPPLWIGSWGSPAGLRRVARLGDGWLASAYHLAPGTFAAVRERLDAELVRVGRDPADVPDAVATMFCQVVDSRTEAREIVTGLLAPALHAEPTALAECLCIGPMSLIRERLEALRAAGAQRVYLWPVRDAMHQLDALAELL